MMAVRKKKKEKEEALSEVRRRHRSRKNVFRRPRLGGGRGGHYTALVRQFRGEVCLGSTCGVLHVMALESTNFTMVK